MNSFDQEGVQLGKVLARNVYLHTRQANGALKVFSDLLNISNKLKKQSLVSVIELKGGMIVLLGRNVCLTALFFLMKGKEKRRDL